MDSTHTFNLTVETVTSVKIPRVYMMSAKVDTLNEVHVNQADSDTSLAEKMTRHSFLLTN